MSIYIYVCTYVHLKNVNILCGIYEGSCNEPFNKNVIVCCVLLLHIIFLHINKNNFDSTCGYNCLINC